MPLRPKYPVSRIVVFRALQLGDLICSVPAFRNLRKGFPHAEISLVGLPWTKIFVERYSSYIDSFIEFPGYPGLKEVPCDLSQLPAFIRRVQEQKFDLAIQMHGCGTIANPLATLFDAKKTAGFFVPGQYCPDPELFIPYPKNEPEIWKMLRIMEALGIPIDGDHLEFSLNSKDFESLKSLYETHGIEEKRYICLHPGARAEWRRWPIESFAAVANILAKSGFQIVITGAADEFDLAQNLSSRILSKAINLAGETDLGSLAALIKNSMLLICNDTGVSHLCAALKVPSVVIFQKSELEGWPPLDRQLHRSACNIAGVSPQDVLRHVFELIQ